MRKRGAKSEGGKRADSVGVRWTEHQGRRVVDEWRSSGLSASEFSRRYGMSPQRLSWWCKRLGEQEAHHGAGRSSTPMITLVPAEVRVRALASASEVTSPTVLRLPHGVSIEFPAASEVPARWVAALVCALGSES